MRFPDFFIVGAPKCGTTSLAYYLRQHPQIFMPENEVHFLSPDFPVHREVKTWEHYTSLFENAPSDAIVGEKSISYLYSRCALEKIKKHNPNAKIIIMLRNPIDMMYSLYLHSLRSGVEVARSFEEALSLEPYRLRGLKVPKGIPGTGGLFYRRLAHYYQYIERYLREFPRENVLIIIFEEFFSDVENEFKKVLQFLGVDPTFNLSRYPAQNVGKKVKNPRLYTFLMGVFLRLPILVFGDYRKKIFPQTFREKVKQIRTRIANLMLEDVREKDIPEELRFQLEAEFLPEAVALSTILKKDIVKIWFKNKT